MLHFFRNFTNSNSFADQCYKEARHEFLISCQSDISMTRLYKSRYKYRLSTLIYILQPY